MAEEPRDAARVYDHIHEVGVTEANCPRCRWQQMSPEEQDALIASGWHPGVVGDDGKFHGRIERSEEEREALARVEELSAKVKQAETPVAATNQKEDTCRTATSSGPTTTSSAAPSHDWFNVSAGFWRSLWLVLRGHRIREWKYLPYELADLSEVDW